jgi:hypothetical protein
MLVQALKYNEFIRSFASGTTMDKPGESDRFL